MQSRGKRSLIDFGVALGADGDRDFGLSGVDVAEDLRGAHNLAT